MVVRKYKSQQAQIRQIMNELTFNKSENLYNMILNGLIALVIAQQSGKVTNKSSGKTLFIGKWLKKAKKQKRYAKNLSSDIEKFLHLYATEGRTSCLSETFYQLYGEFQIVKNTPREFSLSPKQRFDNAMSYLADRDWYISLPLAECEKAVNPYRPFHEKEIYTTKWYWQGAFDEQQQLTRPLSLFVYSEPQAVIDCLFHNGFIIVKGMFTEDEDSNCYYQFILFPENNCTGLAAIPTMYLE